LEPCGDVDLAARLFPAGLGFGGIASGWLYSCVVALMMPFGIGLAFGSEHLLKRGIPSRIARGRYLSALLVVAGLLLALLFAALPDDWLRIGLIAIALGCTPIVYSLGPAVLEVVPAPQRGAMLAINNSVALLAGIAAPVATGALIRNVHRRPRLRARLCAMRRADGGGRTAWVLDDRSGTLVALRDLKHRAGDASLALTSSPRCFARSAPRTG
jgi:hypothetical protein